MAELQDKLSFPISRISLSVFQEVKVRALIGKKWNPVILNEDIQTDPNETGGIEPLHSAKTSFPVKVAFLPLTEAVSPALPEDSILVSGLAGHG